eukprot:COSAG02_NODE_718_length_18064_cov_5.507932_14_plen_517_part_00
MLAATAAAAAAAAVLVVLGTSIAGGAVDPCASHHCPNPGNKTVHSGGHSYPYFYCCPTGHGSDCGQCHIDHTCHCDASSHCCVPGAPIPSPPPTPVPQVPYAGRCNTTAYQQGCTCGVGRVHPPFGAPVNAVRPQIDYHFPVAEPAERLGLVTPTLLSVATDRKSAVLSLKNTTAHLTVGGASLGGWELLHVQVRPAASVIMEHDFDHWSQLVYLNSDGPTMTVRKPVGRLEQIRQPLYDVRRTDPDWPCKQDVDPTDWLGNLGRNMSGGEETTIDAAIALMAPNVDAGLLGNPEDANKFQLTSEGVLGATPWGGLGPQGNGNDGFFTVWSLKEHTTICSRNGIAETKMGMAGRYLRVVNLGRWYSNKGTNSSCGEELLVVSKKFEQGSNESTALLRLSVIVAPMGGATGSTRTSYFRVVVNANGTQLVSVDSLGSDGSDFYRALADQKARWDPFVQSGAIPHLPDSDVRYDDTAASLLTMYMNADRGLTPEYGMGQVSTQQTDALMSINWKSHTD